MRTEIVAIHRVPKKRIRNTQIVINNVTLLRSMMGLETSCHILKVIKRNKPKST